MCVCHYIGQKLYLCSNMLLVAQLRKSTRKNWLLSMSIHGKKIVSFNLKWLSDVEIKSIHEGKKCQMFSHNDKGERFL